VQTAGHGCLVVYDVPLQGKKLIRRAAYRLADLGGADGRAVACVAESQCDERKDEAAMTDGLIFSLAVRGNILWVLFFFLFPTHRPPTHPPTHPLARSVARSRPLAPARARSRPLAPAPRSSSPPPPPARVSSFSVRRFLGRVRR
jgi:hypothetical protein